MEHQESKSDLLNQLKIDRTPPKPKSYPLSTLIGVGCSAAIVGALLIYWLSPHPGVPSAPSELDNARSSSSESSVTTKNTTGSVNTASSSAPSVGETSASQEKQAPQGETILNASGYITARLVATVSAEVAGLITDVDVEEGMDVQAGQVLAKLDDAIAKVNLGLAQAQVKVQEANLVRIKAEAKEASRVFKRVSSLEGDDFSSEAELTRAIVDVERTEALLASSRADIAVAKLNVQQAQEVLDNHTIRAPFAGVVTVKNAQPGEIVSPSSAGGGFTRTGICTIVDMNSLEIEVDVNEAFIRRVYADQRVIANLDAYPQWDIPASVIAIIPTADRAKATVRVRIKIESRDARILPDMGVKVAFLK